MKNSQIEHPVKQIMVTIRLKISQVACLSSNWYNMLCHSVNSKGDPITAGQVVVICRDQPDSWLLLPALSASSIQFSYAFPTMGSTNPMGPPSARHSFNSASAGSTTRSFRAKGSASLPAVPAHPAPGRFIIKQGLKSSEITGHLLKFL